MELRDRLRALVDDCGMTLTQVAEAMPTANDRRTFWRVVSTKGRQIDPRASTLLKIARTLGVHPGELLEGVEFD